jgi:DNA-binding MarR family transcriptional regulator
MSLIGTLSEIKIADVLRLFATGRKSGLLTVADGPHKALLRFQKGAVVHAAADKLSGEEAVVDLFGWHEGQLTFVPEEKTVAPNVTTAVEALIAEGEKVGEVRHRQRELVPSDRVVFQLGPGPRDAGVRLSLGAVEWRVVRLLDGILDVSEVTEAAEMPRAEVVRILVELAQAGFVERVDVLKAFRVQFQGLLGKQAAELDEHIDAEWRKVNRFGSGALRVEIRTAGGRRAPLLVLFRPSLLRDIHLPRGVVAELGLHEGDEVQVRPIA